MEKKNRIPVRNNIYVLIFLLSIVLLFYYINNNSKVDISEWNKINIQSEKIGDGVEQYNILKKRKNIIKYLADSKYLIGKTKKQVIDEFPFAKGVDYLQKIDGSIKENSIIVNKDKMEKTTNHIEYIFYWYSFRYDAGSEYFLVKLVDNIVVDNELIIFDT